MRNNVARVAHFTSSEIHRICGSYETPAKEKASRKKAMTYVAEKIAEKRLGKSVEGAANNRPMLWGKFMEIVLFQLLDIRYRLDSKSTVEHFRHGDIWSGSYDLIVPKVKVGEIKAFQYLRFSKLTDCLMLCIETESHLPLKEQFPDIYWQVVSNAIINKVKKCEVISYMPYESEIPEIQKRASDYDGPDWWDYKWIADAKPEDLPSLPDNGYYSNLTRFEFPLVLEDNMFLTERVLEYGIPLRAA